MTRTSLVVDDEMGQLGERIAESSAVIDSALGTLLADIRAFDAGEGWALQGALSCAHWLSWRVGLDLGAAREKVRVARALGELKLMDAALRRGEVSYSKVRAMTRVANAQNESALLELARASTAAQLEKACRLYRQQTAPSKEALEQSRYVRVRECDDGMVMLTIKVTADQAAMVLEACRVSAEIGNAVEGLMTMAERTLGGGAAADEPGKNKPPVEVVVHVDASTLAGHTETGHGVSAEVSRRLLCDAGVVPVLEDGAGRVIDAGKKRRTVSAALRRALAARDGGCRFPGCSHRRVDAHHLHHWLDGGHTTLENTALLCRRHHRLVHEEGFTVEHADGALTFRDPHGRPVAAAGLRERPLAEDGIVVLRRRADAEALSIDALTAYPSWDGHRPDYDSILVTL